MNNTALRTLRDFHMISQGDRLLAAVSGGADSVALLHFLCVLRSEWGLQLGALHLNHKLRGAESERDERFVRALCAQWHVPLCVRAAPVAELARRRGESVEECARRVRYDFFLRVAEREGAKVATAHTLSDNVETVLLNLTRGTGLRGLGGIPPVRGRVVRPLLRCSRGQVLGYCAAQGLRYVTDSSNHGDDYARNRLRHHVVPLLRRENPRVEGTVGAMTELLRDDAALLDALARRRHAALHIGEGRYSREGLLRLPSALRGRVLGLGLDACGVERSRERVARMLHIVGRGTGAMQLSRAVLFRCEPVSYSFVRIDASTPVHFEHTVNLKQMDSELDLELFTGKVLRLACFERQNLKQSEKMWPSPLKNALDCDKMGEIVNLRQRRPGDRLTLPGRSCSKTLKNLFQERGVPAEERARLAVLAEPGGKVLWVEGVGADAAVAVGPETRRVLLLETFGGIRCTRTLPER